MSHVHQHGDTITTIMPPLSRHRLRAATPLALPRCFILLFVAFISPRRFLMLAYAISCFAARLPFAAITPCLCCCFFIAAPPFSSPRRRRRHAAR